MKKVLITCLGFATFVLSLLTFVPANAELRLQQSTISIPTVTGTPRGVIATVRLDQEDQINVRSGPGVFFDKVGILMPGQEVSVLGRTGGGDWILIEYLGAPDNIGWIYSPYVSITPGEIPIIEPPPTPTPLTTQTINPTLAAQFIKTPISTRKPTFTPAPSFIVPTYTDYSVSVVPGGIPMGLVIFAIAGLGMLLALFSIIQGR
jgi:uncharacterized protein YraI